MLVNFYSVSGSKVHVSSFCFDTFSVYACFPHYNMMATAIPYRVNNIQ